jgi:hypothetical protein
METRRKFSWSVSIYLSILYSGIILFLLSSCGEAKSTSRSPDQSPTSLLTHESPSLVPVMENPPQQTPTIPCNDNLLFIDDVTIPDNSVVSPGSQLDKQWSVQNNGDCNWDSRYRLRLISGIPLGASPEQSLFPARIGTRVTIQILFTAPETSGTYISEWQAFDAQGIPFGDSFFIKIIVQG